MPARIIVRNLRKRYGSVDAVRGISFEVNHGEVFGLLGPNGAGKTSAIECLLGLRVPDAGTLEVCGIDARARPGEAKQKVGAALQTTALQDKITPREALRLFGSFYREHATPEALLERFGLNDKADVAFETLSGGQRQRLALALAFVNKPEVVFLDEPTSGLDTQSRRELHAEIARMKRDGFTVLLTTHYIDEAEELCDRIAIINEGSIVATGTPRELIARSGSNTQVTLEAAQALDADTLSKISGVSDLVCEGSRASFQTDTTTATVHEITQLLRAQGIEITGLSVRKATLEDVFLSLTEAPK
jgi:ABC-2 type transport system ATP-binding protein